MNQMCNASPYEGKESFVVVHFSKKDVSEAYTFIEELSSRGYRIWYQGMENCPREQLQEHAAKISRQIEACEALVALYSAEAASDHQFRKVVTAAVLNGKCILPVFLEDVGLSCGMRMQFDADARINWYTMADDLSSLKGERHMESVRGEPRPDIRVGERAPREKGKADLPEKKKMIWPVSVILEDEESILRGMELTQYAKAKPDTMPDVLSPRGEEKKDMPDERAGRSAPPACGEQMGQMEGLRRRTQLEETAEKLYRQDDALSGSKRGRRGTLIIDEIDPVCICLQTRMCYSGRYGITRIGRDEGCDVCIPDGTVSSFHLEIHSFAGADGAFRNTIRDCGSSNGTWVNGRRLAGGEAVDAGECTAVDLGRKVRLHVVFGSRARSLRERGMLAVLERCDVKEERIVWEETIMLGRHDPWNNGFFDDPRISWEHALLCRTQEGYSITDESSNGTAVNGIRLEKHKALALADGDEIVIGHRRFLFHLIPLNGL